MYINPNMKFQVWDRPIPSPKNEMTIADAVALDNPEGAICFCISATLLKQLLDNQQDDRVKSKGVS